MVSNTNKQSDNMQRVRDLKVSALIRMPPLNVSVQVIGNPVKEEGEKVEE